MDTAPDSFNNEIRNIIKHRSFFQQCEELKNILGPIKKALKSLEFRTTTLVDCFLQLIHMVAVVKLLPSSTNQQFRDECLKIFNYRWNQFDFEIYLIAYFFHPRFRSKYNIIFI